MLTSLESELVLEGEAVIYNLPSSGEIVSLADTEGFNPRLISSQFRQVIFRGGRSRAISRGSMIRGFGSRGTILGILLLLSACALAVAALMTGGEDVLLASLTPVLCNAGVGTLYLIMHGKEGIMQIGIVEKVMERRRIATAGALAERYRGIDLTNTPEAQRCPLRCIAAPDS